MLFAQERIGIFVDGANMFAAARLLNFSIDYDRVREHFGRNTYMVACNYYTAMYEDSDPRNSLRPLVDFLSYNHWSVVRKPIKEYAAADGNGSKVKGNMDVELTIDALNLADRMDRMILMSGDGDFCALVDELHRRGVKVDAVSTIVSNPSMMSDDLRKRVDRFVDIAGERPAIMRKR